MLPLVCICGFLSDEFIDSLVQFLNGIKVIVLDCINDAGRHMLFEDHAADGLDADSIAESWINTSEQSRPSSTIRFVDSI